MRSDLINSRHLEVFLVMMTSQKLSEAALKLSVSEPAVSKTLRLLEREAGVKLFARIQGRLRPTPEAEQIFPQIQRALRHLDLAREATYGLRHNERTQLRLAVGGPALTHLVPQALKQLRAGFPHLQFEVLAERTHAIFDMVANQDVDIGIATPAVADTEARIMQLCETHLLAESLLVAVLPPGHPLAERSVIRVHDLRNETVIVLPENSPTTRLIDATFQQEKAVIGERLIASNSITSCCLVRSGLGIGLVNPLTLGGGMFDDLVVKPFRPRISLLTCAYLPRYQTPPSPVTRLIEYIRQTVKSEGGSPSAPADPADSIAAASRTTRA